MAAAAGAAVVAAAMGGLGGAGTSAMAAKMPTAPVKVMRVKVNGKFEKILTTTKGMTLYWFSLDTATKSACANKLCDGLWPAFTTKLNTTAFAGPKGVTGKFTVVKDVHGKQIAYKGHLLYVYVKDTKAGQTLGEGFLKKWWVTPIWVKPLTAPAPKKKGKGGSGGSGSGSGYGSGGSKGGSGSGGSSGGSGW